MNEKNSIGFSSLSQLLPDGVVQIKKYSIDESKKINHRIDRKKESKILAGNQFLVLCIKGKCRKSINLLSTKPMKALNYNSKHIPNVHPEEARQPLEEEILIHSYISVQAKGNKKKYVDHFQLLKVINKSTYQYIRKAKRTLLCGCTVCKGWICYTHFNDKYKLLFEQYNIPPLTYERMEVIGNKIAFVCHDCINKVKEPIEEQQLYIQEYFRLQYGIDGRNSLKKIRASEGHKWLVVNADYLIYYFIEELKYDVNKFQLLIKDSDWMKKGYDDDEKENGIDKFLSLIKKYRDKSFGKAEAILIPANDTEIVRDVIRLKEDIISYICVNVSLLKKKPLVFRKLLWRMIEEQVDQKYRYIKFFHDLEAGIAHNETSMETGASEVGGVYTPNRRAFKNENLKQKVVNKRTLSKNLKVRRRIVKKVQPMANKVFKNGGMLKYKRRNNIKYSQTLDRKENLDDDRLGVITIEDLID
eukprot:174865_1